MKKRILFLIIILILVGLFCYTSNLQLVSADSGFDSSYDSGSSDSGGDLSSIIYLIYLCIEYPPLAIIVIILGIIFYFDIKKSKNKLIEGCLNNNKLHLLNVNEYDDKKKLEIEAFNIYSQLQYAWMNFDEDTIRKYTTDEMYNMYLMQMDTLKVKNQKNIMCDINYLGSYIENKFEENGQETISIILEVSCRDFIIDTTTNKVVRGNIDIKRYTYKLTFVKTVDNKDIDVCPRCSAPVEGNNSGVCEYCRSTLINNNYTLVLSKKEMKYQK